MPLAVPSDSSTLVLQPQSLDLGFPFCFCHTPSSFHIAIPFTLKGYISLIIILFVIPFTPHAFWRPFPIACVLFSSSVTRAGHWLVLYILAVPLKQLVWDSAKISYLGLLDCKTVCEQTRHPKSSPFWWNFICVYNTLVWMISQIPGKKIEMSDRKVGEFLCGKNSVGSH